MKNQVKKVWMGIAVVAGFLMLTGFAVNPVQLKVTVPFSFMTGDTLLPAGDYFVSALNGNQIVTLRQLNGNAVANVYVRVTEKSVSGQDGYLSFQRYGTENYLRDIYSSYSSAGLTVPKSSKEKKMATEIARNSNPNAQPMLIAEIHIPISR